MRSQTDKAAEFLYYWRLFAGIDAPQPAEEYRFDLTRKWRFDFAWPSFRVAVEVNGEAWHTKGGGRHGKAADLEKMNAAQAQGWRVYQYTPAMLGQGPVSCIGQVKEALGL